MTYVAIGSLAFGFLVIFDFNKIFGKHNALNAFFAVGVTFLMYASIMLITQFPANFDVHPIARILFIVLSGLSGAFMFYALFGALPFSKTYVEVHDNSVIDTGVYALCRHPGVYGFFFMYFFAFLASGRVIVLIACLVWTGLDIIHVWLQDVIFFPKMLKGYQDYQKSTPFLLFNMQSLQRCTSSFRK